MRITWLLEQADRLSGGVKVAIEDANWLAARGHDVTVVSKSGPPAWMELRCAFRRVDDFHPAHLPPADVRIGISASTIHALLEIHWSQTSSLRQRRRSVLQREMRCDASLLFSVS